MNKRNEIIFFFSPGQLLHCITSLSLFCFGRQALDTNLPILISPHSSLLMGASNSHVHPPFLPLRSLSNSLLLLDTLRKFQSSYPTDMNTLHVQSLLSPPPPPPPPRPPPHPPPHPPPSASSLLQSYHTANHSTVNAYVLLSALVLLSSVSAEAKVDAAWELFLFGRTEMDVAGAVTMALCVSRSVNAALVNERNDGVINYNEVDVGRVEGIVEEISGGSGKISKEGLMQFLRKDGEEITLETLQKRLQS